MFFFKRRRKEKSFEKKFEELNGEVLTEKDKGNPQKVEHYVIERLEQMIGVTKEIEDERSEYRIVTSYLNDIQTIENMSEEEKKKISDIARNIISLNQTRDELLHAEKKITDAQFAQMQQEEADIPDAIKRLRSNEKYLDTIKRDMHYLEREKEEWNLNRELLIHDQNKMQKLMYINLGLALSFVIILFIIQVVLQTDIKLAWTVLIFASVVGVCVPYLKIMSDKQECKQSEVNANRAIWLLNKVKIKFVNMTNAVDYACEKYHVHNSSELERAWEYYMDAVKQKEKFEQNNDDLEYFNNRMIRELTKFSLYDTKVWLPQAKALVDHKEMVEVTHNLVTRRQKLRSRIESNMEIMNSHRKEVEDLMDKIPQMRSQIQEILDSVDRLSRVV